MPNLISAIALNSLKAFKAIAQNPKLIAFLVAGVIPRLILTKESNSLRDVPEFELRLKHFFDSQGSDKAMLHNYQSAYAYLLPVEFQRVFSLLEIGIGTTNPDIPFNMGRSGTPGASLRAWRLLYPNADIFGSDIDSLSMINEPGIKSYICDQTNKLSMNILYDNLRNALRFPLEVVIDDGYHEFNANLLSLSTLFPLLSKGGIYIIEDVSRWYKFIWIGVGRLMGLKLTIFNFPSAKQNLLLIAIFK